MTDAAGHSRKCRVAWGGARQKERSVQQGGEQDVHRISLDEDQRDKDILR